MPTSSRRYFILDVFTDEALSGNPLAVVMDSEGLDDGQMQQIAREFNLSETVFVLPSEKEAHNSALRIFTPTCELPFAGHPTVGAAVLLGTHQNSGNSDVLGCMLLLEEQVGLVRARVSIQSDRAGHATFDVPKLSEPYVVELGSKDEIAAALGLHINDIGFENHVPTAFSAGVPFAMIPIRNREAIERAYPVLAGWKTAFGAHEHNDAYLYTRETLKHGSSFHTRMFAPTMGIMEDPATGSAAAAFAGAICQFDKPGDGSHSFTLEQGFEMGRPSIIALELDIENGALKAERVGGNAVVTASGHLYI